MKKTIRKAVSALAGSSMLLSAAAVQAEADVNIPVTVTEAQGVEYKKVSNIKGEFAFNQDEVTPTDEVFNIFGTVLTGVCAAPSFTTENAEATVYINVGGKVKESYTVNLSELSEKEEDKIMGCFCATGPASANVKVTGIKLEDVLALAEVEEGVNTVTAVSADGYKVALPLNYVLEKEAMIVYKVNDEKIPSGTQLWVPSTVAKYFTRNVVDIELSVSEVEPEIEQRADELRAEVAILNNAENETFNAGEAIAFEGYADDCGSAIAAVEFSMDGGEKWDSFETTGATSEKWVYWNYAITAEEAGDYQLTVRAKTENGIVSPLSAKLNFTVK